MATKTAKRPNRSKELAAKRLPVPVLGRPPAYQQLYVEKAYKLCLLGATDQEIADIFSVSVETLNDWKRTHADFSASFTHGKTDADANIAHSMYHRALGYSHKAVKIFMPAGATEPVYAEYTEHYPPDTAAAKHWLANRRGKDWREKQEVEHSGSIGLEHWVLESLGKPQSVIEGSAREVEEE